MPSFKKLFPSKYLRAADIDGETMFTIASVGEEQVGPDKELKPVVRFAGESRGLVLNQTNAKTVAELYGEDTDGWLHKPIVLYHTTTEMGGKTVPCTRVKNSVPPTSPRVDGVDRQQTMQTTPNPLV